MVLAGTVGGGHQMAQRYLIDDLPAPPPADPKDRPPAKKRTPPPSTDEAPETPPSEPEPVPVKDPPPEPDPRGPYVV
jgi:hypothetical protein